MDYLLLELGFQKTLFQIKVNMFMNYLFSVDTGTKNHINIPKIFERFSLGFFTTKILYVHDLFLDSNVQPQPHINDYLYLFILNMSKTNH